MSAKPLSGRRIAVIVESKFIADEIQAYRHGFAALGAEVHLVSRIHYDGELPNSATFYSDIDPLEDSPWQSPQTLTVTRDVRSLRLNEYAAIIMAANYPSVRLRYEQLPAPLAELSENQIASFNAVAHVRSPPAARLFADAMTNKRLIKGALCHGLWLLTPYPELLQGRRVICHSVVMADVINCGAEVVLRRSGIVVDDDLITGFSRHEVTAFIDAIASGILERP